MQPETSLSDEVSFGWKYHALGEYETERKLKSKAQLMCDKRAEYSIKK